MDELRIERIKYILKHKLHINKSLDTLYEEYWNGNFNRAIILYNKQRGLGNIANPHSVYFNYEPFIK